MTRRPVQVTDHALVQYLSRVWGVDTDALKARIGRQAQIASDLDAECVNHNGVRFVVRAGTVKTVLARGMHCHLRRHPK